MTFKEFIKPTLTKVILAIIIFLISPIKLHGFGASSKWVWFFGIELIKNFKQYNPTILIITPLASYLLSIIIIFVYNKIKTKS